MPRSLIIRLVSVAALVACAVGLVVVVTGGQEDHKITAVLSDANYISPGTKVVIGGSTVGSVTSADVTSSGQARLTMAITDSRVWPLSRATRLRIRWLSTIAYAGRYVELQPPPTGGSTLPDGGQLASGAAATPVEFDQVFKTFNPATRAALRSTLRTTGTALGRAGAPLGRALDSAPPAVSEARSLMQDLGSQSEALDTLVTSTDHILAGVQRSDPGLSQFIDGAQRTFHATATRQQDLARMLNEAAPTLGAARHTLARADLTLGLAGDLTSRISGGSQELRRLATPLAHVLTTVRQVGPDATQTLAQLRAAAPDLNPFLARARELMPQLQSVAGESAKQLACIRPYAPEVAGLASTWSGFEVQGDNKDKYARIDTPALPFDQLPASTAQAAKLFPSLRYAFPRPPGEVAGQPWFIPECGVGPDSVDPSKDPEAP